MKTQKIHQGEVIRVYEHPITNQGFVGKARVMGKAPVEVLGGTGLERYMVVFLNGLDAVQHFRWVNTRVS